MKTKIIFPLVALMISTQAFSLVPLTRDIIPGFPLITEEDFAPTPLFLDKQVYLGASPIGVGTDIAWKLPGGKGENVKIIDIETGMNDSHEDLPRLFHATVPKNSDHGTAVMGIMGALENDYGMIGIAHKAEFGFAGFIEGDGDIDDQYIKGIVKQIKAATAELSAGDIMVIEQQVTGPKGDYILVEYWDEIFVELKAATDKGIHCVAAAGNGGSNLDHPIYKNLLNRTVRDSGCIVVGAAKIGENSRLDFSNYGVGVDAFGYGRLVPATGYGDLFNSGVNGTYTGRFSGTSSATPIVAGAVALVSSIAIEQGKTISPKRMRNALRTTGIDQGGDTSGNIGKFPSIGNLLKHFKLAH